MPPATEDARKRYEAARDELRQLANDATSLATKIEPLTSGGGGHVILAEDVALEASKLRRQTRVAAERYLVSDGPFARNIAEALATVGPRRSAIGVFADRTLVLGLKELAAALGEASKEAEDAASGDREPLGFRAA